MGTILDALTFKFLTKLGQVIENEVVMTLSVNKDIKRLKNNLEHFSAIREDAEALAMEDKRIEAWWKNMSNVMFDIDVIIDLVMVHSQKLLLPPRSVCCNQSMISCFGKLSFDHRVARRIKDINEKLDEIKMNTEMFTLDRTTRQQFQVTIVDRRQTSPVDELEVVGTEIKQAGEDMVQMIVSSCRENRSSVFGIQGMGGIGKTTLAQKIYNEPLVREKFQVRIWLCISQSYTETGLIKQAIRMAGEKCDQLETKTELLPLLVDSIKGKSVLLVLDDVWKSDVWIDLFLSPFKRALNFHVLVTTRDLDVLAEMHATYTHQVNTMNYHDGLELLMKKSFQPYEQISEFKNVGYEIVKKCDGLPLAIKVVAGVLSTKRTTAEWKSIRDSKWSIHGLPKELGGPLYLSYSSLPPQLKECFLWCALLPPNFEIHRDSVAYWWVAEGLVRKEHGFSIHEIAEEYYLELVRRNLLQPVPEYVDKAVSTMHDLLRSLGQYLTKDHSLCMNVERIDAMSNLRRLGISHAVEEIPTLEEHKCLRSLLLFNNKNFKSMHKDIFRKLEHIRVLVLSGTSIKDIPDSVGNLVLLRLLDLSYTEINKLPESIGSLISLEYLSLLGCRQLDSLPAGLMRLSNISFLHLEQTSIDHVPKGIAKFQQLYNLRGVFESGTGFRLDELRCLPNIQRLWVSKLEEAMPGSELVLKNSRNLKELGLRCTMKMGTHDRTRYEHDKVWKIQQVYDMLVPSPSLEYIFLVGFPGTMFPEWLRSKPELNMPSLRQMHLDECISCSELPPAGQMPQLQFLKIKGADAIESIGEELLGKEAGSPAAIFPKLEVLQVIRMFSLRSWSLNTGNPSDSSQHISLMPCLKRLLLLDCPKLRALPRDMSNIVNLKRIHIEGAHKLQEVVDLPAVTWLKVKNNTRLRTISNLCKLQDLLAQDCPALDQAKNLCSLRRLYMVDCPHEQEFRKCLSEEQGVLVHVATVGADGRNIFPDESLYN
ncbi:putative disease resistance protein RGA4 [Hordeum vulgare subsp. vulgare]|uniref:NBS-LRR disease resistance protein homologue n=2 Tax=Hordeum vulgare TaxID=4513 RepID=M0X499_HORVV|nr:putative disease resistance protein RGA4 [Hordeum vulgare subsp. vulgare]XP_044974734.1 putative disease resistance protein RGA4 [Hordeum vulgare subsp. vulgare]